MAKPKYITVAQFAKLIGVSTRRVCYVVSKGQITSKVIKGKNMVDPKVAKKQWGASISKGQNPSGKKKPSKQVPGYIAPPKKDSDGETTMVEAERQDKVWKSQLSELKYLEQAGKLIEVDIVKKRVFELARRARDQLMNIPARKSYELAAETDPHKLELMLKKELQQVIEMLVKGIRAE